MTPAPSSARASRSRRRAGGRSGRIAVLLVLLALAAAGCGGGGGELGVGCFTGDAVPAPARRAVQAAASTLFGHARQGEWQAIYDAAAAPARQGKTAAQLTAPMVRVSQAVGFPAELRTETLSLVRFGPDFPFSSHVECAVKGTDDPLTLILTDQPVQASLVQTGEVGGDRFYFSTLWFREDGDWKLASFFAKPATLYGKDWQAWRDEAAKEYEADRLRNAALLYNAAIDLAVPAAWEKPPAILELQRRQRRISVEHLPSGRLDAWPVDADSVQVRSVNYMIQPQAMGILVQYQARAAIADSTAQAALAERIRDYVARTFPEYARVFGSLTLLAYDPADPQKSWHRTYPLGGSR